MKKQILYVFFMVFAITSIISTAAALNACSQNESGGGASVTTADSDVSDSPAYADGGEDMTPEAVQILDGLPEADYDGYEFRVLSRSLNYNSHWFARDIFAEEETGDAINDAVYRRNRAVEEKYNMKIVNIPADDPSSVASRSIRAGDDQFDIISHGLSHAVGHMTSGELYDLHLIPNINLSAPWWDPKAREQLTINGRLFATTSDYIILDKDATWIIMFNKQLLQDFGLDDPYDMVKSGAWTMDRMFEMMSAAALDLNGDNVMDENDQWGLVSQHYNALAFFNAAGEAISMANSTPDNQPEITLYNQRAVNVSEKIIELQTDKNITLNADDYTGRVDDVWDGLQLVVFNTNRGLFYYAGMNRVTLLRDMETDFGIIPPPKFDENQSEYYIAIHPWCSSSVAVPVTNTDTGRTGMILEALTAESRYTLLPAYYDITLKTKFARDNESHEMLDIIFANRIYDLGQVFDWGGAPAFFEQLSRGANTLTSFWERNETRIAAAMERTLEAMFD